MLSELPSLVRLETRHSRVTDFDMCGPSRASSFAGDTLTRAVDVCFERRGTPWSAELLHVLTTAFYRAPAMKTLWRNYLAARAVLEPPPAQFTTTDERIVQLLAPVRDRILSGDGRAKAWPPGGPWSAPVGIRP